MPLWHEARIVETAPNTSTSAARTFSRVIAIFMGRQPAHNLTPRQPRRGLLNEMK